MTAALVLASRNPHKLREARRILEPYGLKLTPLPETVTLPTEGFESFAANALGKARAAAAQLGVAAIADDSGIEAAALGGRPGVRSARYAGEHASDAENLAKLLHEAPPGSALRYACTVAYVAPEASAPPLGQRAGGGGQRLVERVFDGRCDGRLAARPRGERGFGYDPAFLPDDALPGLTMAELGDAEKDRISHRGRALRAFAQWLTDAGATAG